MKKWMILLLIAVLLCGYGAMVQWWSVYKPSVEFPAETQPAQLQQPTEVTEETIPATEAPTLPPETQPVEETQSHLQPNPDYVLKAHHAFVYDVRSGQLRFALGGMEDQIAPASLTKLLTALVALQYLQPEDMVLCGEETSWIDPASSVAWVSRGDVLTVEYLIQGMMMQSGNDAAYVVAVAAGRRIAGDPELNAKKALAVFMEEVNRQAQLLGLTGTHFATPDGVDTYDHYTTMEDMLKIALLARENTVIRHYTGLAVSTVAYENGETHTYRNTNYLLDPQSKYYCADACGMKTGTTKKAGSCLMSLFHNGEGYVLIGVFGCPKYEDRFTDALQLYALYGGKENSSA